jgi:hypothetical protein
MYRHLDAAKIDETVAALLRRVAERFPDSGLARVCTELAAVVRETEQRCLWIAEPKLWLRGLVVLVLALMAALVGGSVLALRLRPENPGLFEVLQGVEAATNELVLLGLAVLFLVNLETRIKRSRALAGLHELRALAHVIDMHQLTKDPERALAPGADTPSSPERRLNPFELMRYLDYCSEMLAVIGKAAALYGQYLQDPVILAAVNEIEHLATHLSQKIWQKITTLEIYRERAAPATGSAPRYP